MSLEPGTTLGTYEIVASIGAGGMGEVYVAHDTKLDRRVAVKVLPDELSRDEGFRRRFEREAKALAALSHPNILAVYDFGHEEGTSYAVTELLEGRTLSVVLKENSLPIAKAIEYSLQLARGLAAAHAKNIVHRDLKPDNLFVTRDGHVKILDFGLAKLAAPFAGDEESETLARDTQPGTVMGTMGYMSPEQVRGLDADPRSDIFSAGAVLYEMLTGRRAFTGNSGADTVSAILNEDARIPEDAAVSPGLARIVQRCLEKRPEDRFQSARDLAFAVETVSGVAREVPRTVEDETSDTSSIAVLPFVDMSPGKDQDYFCEGMAEEIMSALTGIPGLRVAARSSAFRFRGGEHDLREVGDALHVKTVLEGSVRTAGKKLRVTAQLNQVDGSYQLWSRRYDRELEDVFAIQDEIASDIVDALRLELSDADAPRVVRHTENEEAYDLYLRGRHLWYARTKGTLAKAMEYYEQAVAKDPGYALPYVGLADGYTAQALYAYLPEDVAAARAKELLSRALAINDRLAEAHRSKGFTQVLLDYDMRAAVVSLEKSIELDPSNALAHVYLAWCAWPGRETVCLAAARRAQELDPMNPYVNAVTAMALDFLGRIDEALQSFRRALEFDHDYLPALFGIGGLYSKMGRHEEALAAFTTAVELSGRGSFYLAYLGWGLGRAGQVDEARAILNELSERAEKEYVAPLHLAMVVSALGELDRAFALLGEAFEKGNCWVGSPRLPFFDAFRDDPRFDALLERMNHPDR